MELLAAVIGTTTSNDIATLSYNERPRSFNNVQFYKSGNEAVIWYWLYKIKRFAVFVGKKECDMLSATS